ncbi:uncharacterized protein PAE49_020951 [Odontesthes bonariensis]|uniref:uncharacterized protein LOC142368676 n=1 Tax=Odontesthes bonariensis TaxID=219752 RepID=UPI003F5851A1
MATNIHDSGQRHTLAEQQIVEDELHRESRRSKMMCSRCLLPFLALCMLLEQISAAVLPSTFKNKREANWLDQEVFSRLSDPADVGDLSVGDAGEMSRDVSHHPSRSGSLVDPTEHFSVQNQHQHNRKVNEKRRKVAPLDSIGRFQMSSFRNRKDEPDVDQEDYMD